MVSPGEREQGYILEARWRKGHHQRLPFQGRIALRLPPEDYIRRWRQPRIGFCGRSGPSKIGVIMTHRIITVMLAAGALAVLAADDKPAHPDFSGIWQYSVALPGGGVK